MSSSVIHLRPIWRQQAPRRRVAVRRSFQAAAGMPPAGAMDVDGKRRVQTVAMAPLISGAGVLALTYAADAAETVSTQPSVHSLFYFDTTVSFYVPEVVIHSILRPYDNLLVRSVRFVLVRVPMSTVPMVII